MALLDDLIANFSRVNNKFLKATDLWDAVLKEAHSDMSRRAEGHTPQVQKDSVEWLKNHFQKNSPFGITDSKAFDVWHQNTCAAYCTEMNNKESEFFMSKGRAQKVLNMTFKYLFCTQEYRQAVEQIAPYLHMTLDGYTLTWYKEVVVKWCNDEEKKKEENKKAEEKKLEEKKPKLAVGNIPEWSKLDESGDHAYSEIQKRIRKYLENAEHYIYTINPEVVGADGDEKPQKKQIEVKIPLDPQRKFPFYGEFIVWEGEIVRAKMRDLLAGLNGIYKSWGKDQWAVNEQVKEELFTRLEVLLAWKAKGV